MASSLEAATEHFEVVAFKAAIQLDLTSLQDHKNMLLSKGKVYSATGPGKSFYKSFVVVQFSSILFNKKLYRPLRLLSE